MSNRQLEDLQELRLRRHVADELGLTLDVLDDFEFEVDANASNDGMVYGLRVLWVEAPPPGARASGIEGAQWSDIRQMSDDHT